MFSCMLALTQEECKDIVYPTGGKEIINDCCINAIKYGNVVYYKKDGKTAMIPAYAINWNDQYIKLTENEDQLEGNDEIDDDPNNVLSVGDRYQGGIVFFTDYTGEHGLIAAPYDQTTKKVSWGHNSITDALSPNDGLRNSEKILHYHNNRYQYGVYCAARFCDTLSIGGYTAWYLPAIDELRLMYEERKIIGGFKAGDYCSSTEYGKKDAYSIHFRPCKQIEYYYNNVQNQIHTQFL